MEYAAWYYKKAEDRRWKRRQKLLSLETQGFQSGARGCMVSALKPSHTQDSNELMYIEWKAADARWIYFIELLKVLFSPHLRKNGFNIVFMFARTVFLSHCPPHPNFNVQTYRSMKFESLYVSSSPSLVSDIEISMFVVLLTVLLSQRLHKHSFTFFKLRRFHNFLLLRINVEILMSASLCIYQSSCEDGFVLCLSSSVGIS